MSVSLDRGFVIHWITKPRSKLTDIYHWITKPRSKLTDIYHWITKPRSKLTDIYHWITACTRRILFNFNFTMYKRVLLICVFVWYRYVYSTGETNANAIQNIFFKPVPDIILNVWKAEVVYVPCIIHSHVFVII